MEGREMAPPLRRTVLHAVAGLQLQARRMASWPMVALGALDQGAPDVCFRCAHPVQIRVPTNSASSRHFQWQSTSTKPISRSQFSCV